MWDPGTYLRYGDERARPFVELLARVDAGAPERVVDLGCGPGTLTVSLASRWPKARIEGVDSSPEMIDQARSLGAGVDFTVGDVRDWSPGSTVDVIVSNAVLQWVPDHGELLVRWARSLTSGGWLAFQVPGNFDAPSHVALRRVAGQPRWRDRLADLVREPGAVLDPTGYAALLRAGGMTVDAWETTYLHLLPGSAADHPVLRWMEGTALRPVRAALADPGEWAEFRVDLGARLAEAYPVRDGMASFPFRRIFVVARS